MNNRLFNLTASFALIVTKKIKFRNHFQTKDNINKREKVMLGQIVCEIVYNKEINPLYVIPNFDFGHHMLLTLVHLCGQLI